MHIRTTNAACRLVRVVAGCLSHVGPALAAAEGKQEKLPWEVSALLSINKVICV